MKIIPSQNIDQPDDEELVNLLKLGDEKAFELIYLKYWEKLYSIAKNWLKSEETAKELVQGLFTNLWAKRESLDICKSLSSYIFSSMKYMIFDYIDSGVVRQKYLEEYKYATVNFDNSTEEKLSFDELYLLLDHEVNMLPEKSKIVFNLSRKEHLSNKEIAVKLAVSPKTVEYHLSKATTQLRRNLKDFILSLFFIFLSL